MTHLNLFDVTVLIVVGLSALLSFYRGFVREVLSLGSWLVASFVTLRFLEPATNLIKPQVNSQPIAVAVAAIGLFIITLILFSIATGLIVKALKPGDRAGLLDNLAGLCFGFARGALIVAIAYFVMSKFFTDEKNYPKLVREAATRPYVARAAHWLGTLTPDYLDHVMHQSETALKNATSESNINEQTKKVHDLMDSQRHTLDSEPDDEPKVEKGSTLPSFDDLQNRIRNENEGH